MKIENKTPIAEEIIRNNPTGHGLFAGMKTPTAMMRTRKWTGASLK